MTRKASNVLDLIGDTPLLRINSLTGPNDAEVWAKAEYFNPLSSIKDRICLAMIEDAEKRGALKPGMKVVEPTSGNTGTGLAMVCAIKGYSLVLVMPETMSIERRTLLKALGAEIVLTPANEGMSGAVRRAEEIVSLESAGFMPQQFNNPANPDIHEKTTAEEIWQATEGKVDAFVAGVGTGGTLTGVARALKRKNPHILVVAVEPASSAVLSGGKPGPHNIQGIGAGFVPKVLDLSIVDRIIAVSNEDATQTARRLAKREAVLVGYSAGANCFAAAAVARELGHGKIVTTVLCDTGERYLSTGLFSS
ncbi:MAG TPA: cysteine synthase A [Candidatus Brocadiia bacterium]|nr:cysteine synthase A [Candidatus Brocadiia bacterium]